MASYSDQQKSDALASYVELGPREVSRQTGITASTITRWAQAAGLRTLRAEKATAAAAVMRAEGEASRARVSTRLLEEIHETFDRLREAQTAFVGQSGKRVEYPKPPAPDHFALVKSIGTLLDKLRLEEGQVTDRTEDVSQSEFDREVAELVGKVRQQGMSEHDAAHHRVG